MVTVTEEMLRDAASPRGGWTKRQLALLGVAWPPATGWKRRVLGTNLSEADAAVFLALRGT